jgi:predicted NBD/HSP70 family sugar kinase
MGLYTGFDLHSSNTYVGIIDEDGKRIWKKKLRNDPSLISSTV